MKLKSLIATVVFMMVSTIALNAQDKKVDDLARKQNHTQVKNRYELQKRTIETEYKNSLEALKAQTNLTPVQRKQQREAIQSRYNEQKKANQDTYKLEKDALKENRHNSKDSKVKESKVKDEQKPMKQAKPVKPVKPVKAHKPSKH